MFEVDNNSDVWRFETEYEYVQYCFSSQEKFVRGKTIFYWGGVETTVCGKNIEKWGVSEVLKLVIEWGYDRNEFRVWSKLEGIYDSFFEVNKDDRDDGVVSYPIGNNIEGYLYVAHTMWRTSMSKYLNLNALI